MNKQAILIIAHNNEWTLKKIIESLDSEYFDIFIHIDVKSGIELETLKPLAKKSNLYLYKEYDIRWADVSQVECEIFLLKQALTTAKYKYFHLVSGVDLPIKSAKEIYEFFDSYYDTEFVHFASPKIPKNKENYYRKYHKNIKKYRKNIFEKVKNKISLFIQTVIGIDRQKNSNVKFMTGANWFSITDKLASYVVEKERWVLENFTQTRSADEIFLQTLIYNSEFKEKLYDKNYDNNYESCMRLIDWNRGNPYIFSLNDFDEIKKSKCMFARKFDEKKDKEIIEKITLSNKK